MNGILRGKKKNSEEGISRVNTATETCIKEPNSKCFILSKRDHICKEKHRYTYKLSLAP